MFLSKAVKWLQSVRHFLANVRQKEQFVGVKGMSETVQVVHGLLKDEILHLDLTLGIISIFFISYIRLTVVIRARGVGGG